MSSATDLVIDFGSGKRQTRALAGVSVCVRRGAAVGLIGESGSGKTTLARSLMGMVKPTSGSVTFRDENIYTLKEAARFRLLSRNVGFVFQDPRSSLNPRFTVGAVIADPLEIHGIGARSQRSAKVSSLLEDMGLSAELRRRPIRSLSGGQLQRVALARALALEPELLVADEPTSALDISVQAQILKLIRRARLRRDLALLVVSHDIRVIRHLTDETVVMYQGSIVESGPTADVCDSPTHPYTKKLLSSVPHLP